MNIFDENPSEIVTIEADKDYVADLVGEGKKFKDLAGLARGKLEADNYIKELTSKLDGLKKELDGRTSLDQFLTEMKDLRAPPQNGQVQPSTPAPVQTDPLDDSTLEQRLLEILERRSAQEKQESNRDFVGRVLAEQFGDQASYKINQKAKDLGMSVKDLENLALKSPQAFFNLVGVQERQAPVNVPVARQSINSTSQVQTTGVKNKAYFENLKRTNRKAYDNPKTVSEMVAARQDCAQRGIPWE